MGFLRKLFNALLGASAAAAERTRAPRRARHAPAKLAALGLPNLKSRPQLAQALDIPLGTLNWLLYHERAEEPRHYAAFAVPKRSGGYRVIYAPKTRLKAVQQWIRREILDRVPTTPVAHGFVRGRSILTNAQPHGHAAIVLKLDLQDFFPSITFRRVRGVFQQLGYGRDVATDLALLCTVPPSPRVQQFLGNIRHRMLPQGAPTSPALSNLVCRRLDGRLAGLARKFGCAYSRYADDLTFSGDEDFQATLKRFIPLLNQIIKDESLRVNRRKRHFARRGARQTVTGLTVNDGPNVPRRYRRQLRAILHNARATGLEAQNRDGHPHFTQALHGRIEFVRTTHPDLADQLLAQLNALT